MIFVSCYILLTNRYISDNLLPIRSFLSFFLFSTVFLEGLKMRNFLFLLSFFAIVSSSTAATTAVLPASCVKVGSGVGVVDKIIFGTDTYYPASTKGEQEGLCVCRPETWSEDSDHVFRDKLCEYRATIGRDGLKAVVAVCH